MQRAKTVSLSPANMDDDNIAASQTPSGAGAVTLNGAAVVGGVAILDIPRRVMLTCAGNNSARSFVITGTLDGNSTISETMAGANTTSASSLKDYKTVTSITIDGASTGAIKFGTTDGTTAGSSTPALSSPWNPIGVSMLNGIGLSGVVTGTINYGVQHAMDNPFSTSVNTYLTPFNNDFIQGQTGNAVGSYSTPVRAVRFIITSYTSGATLVGQIVPGASG